MIITDYTGLKFALYTRKSTLGEQSQANSIEDQRAICTDFAAKHKINIVKEFSEDRSAKYAGKRKEFKAMIAEIKRGHIDAILAYHPDRLARNMTEGGMIVDMLQPPDEKSTEPTLKDLAFPTMTFSNDSGGRLSLSVQFTLATNYSDHLSEQIKRGNSENLNERGISNGTPKWGYERDERTGEYKPDKNWETVKHAWDILLAGGTQKEAIEYLMESGIHRMTKITHKNKVRKPKYVNKNTKMFKDPFYYGELRQGENKDENPINLCEKWPDFKPMITKEEFLRVQKEIALRAYNGSKKAYKATKSTPSMRGKDFLPLKKMVYCAECHQMMRVAKSSGNGGEYVYYTCRNKDCKHCGKGVRGKVIFDHLYETLSKIVPDEDTFEKYEADLDEYINIELKNYEKQVSELRGELSQLVVKHKAAKAKYANVAAQGDDAPEGVLADLKEECDKAKARVDEQNALIKAIEEKIANPELLKMTKEEFANLIKMAADKMKAADLQQKDQIARIIFANLEVSPKKGPLYLCNPEFKGLFRGLETQLGSTDWDRTSDLGLMSPTL